MTPKKAKTVTLSPKPSASPEVKPRTRAKSATANTQTPSPIVELAAKPTIKRHVSASARKSKAVVVESAPASNMKLDRTATTDEVALRAYHIWMERGCPQGTSTEDWLSAETELLTMSATA